MKLLLAGVATLPAGTHHASAQLATTPHVGARPPGMPTAPHGVGILERAQGEVRVIRAGNPLPAATGWALLRRDRIQTGELSRAALLFADGTRLLLGADAELLIEDHLPQQGRKRGKLLLAVPAGAFRLIPSPLAAPPIEPAVLVRTRDAMLLLGTADLWAGPTPSGAGVLALAGSVEVRNSAGSLTLARKRQGTMLRSAGTAPEQPAVWNRTQIEAALLQVAFD